MGKMGAKYNLQCARLNCFKNELLVWHTFTINDMLVFDIVYMLYCGYSGEEQARWVYWIFQWKTTSNDERRLKREPNDADLDQCMCFFVL